MASDIIIASDAWAAFTLSLAPAGVGLATGTSRQSTILDNSGIQRPAANFGFDIESGGTAPTAGAIYELFLIRGEDATSAAGTVVRDDGAGPADAGITIINSSGVGTLIVTATANAHFLGVFTTANLGVLGNAWGSAVRNSSGQALNNTEANHKKKYMTYRPRSIP